MSALTDWLSELAQDALPPFIGAGVAGAIDGGSAASAGNGNSDSVTGIAAGAATGAGDAVAGFWDGLSSFPASLVNMLPSSTSITVWLVLIVIGVIAFAYLAREVEG